MKRSPQLGRTGVVFLCALAWLALSTRAAHAENWPRFRGPNGAGISSENGFPATWSDGDYAWKTELPGVGHSSPCVWEDHVFLTSAEDKGRIRIVLDVSASTGKIRWIHRLDSKTYKINNRNSYASATPATDGKRVYVTFGNEREYLLLAYDFEGNQLWKYDLGPFISQHGAAISPIVFEDLVILGNDQDAKSFIVAVDSSTGKPRWKVDRNEKQRETATAYATPILIQGEGGKRELIFTSLADGFTSYDPRTGAFNWRADLFPARTCGSPVFGHGLLYATCGGGGNGKLLLAVRPGGQGDLGESCIAWERAKELPYVPTPVLTGDHIYLWCDNGVVSCVEAKTGKNIWTERIERTSKFSGSPICVDGKLYCVSEEGEVIVLAARPDSFQLLGRTSLGEGSHATPAVSNGSMFIRGFEHLFCLGADKH
ncbi:MAG: PQQ-binding-like beta-propeller repeat protein [Planctomycetes bacterium]|nr:PQQ-binding-like beta-propeller repeat protein [Planctomycetota bacterium]